MYILFHICGSTFAEQIPRSTSEVKDKSVVSPCLSENQFLYHLYLSSCQASVLCQSGGSEILAKHLSESLICILPDVKRPGQMFGDPLHLPLYTAYVHFPLPVIHLIVAFLHQVVYISGGYLGPSTLSLRSRQSPSFEFLMDQSASSKFSQAFVYMGLCLISAFVSFKQKFIF